MPRCLIKLDDLPPAYQDQVRAQLDALATLRSPRQCQPDGARALEQKDRNADLLEDPAGTLHIRIVRVGGRTMDSDNLPSGYKALRDAIAAAFGRRGDSEGDGWIWEYAQEPGEIGTRIEIYTEELSHA